MSVYKRMTEWTSLSVTEEQKRKIQSAQKDAGHDGAIGRFIVQQVTGGSTTQTQQPVTLEATEVNKIAKEVAHKLEGVK